jgi:hypothetical protein
MCRCKWKRALLVILSLLAAPAALRAETEVTIDAILAIRATAGQPTTFLVLPKGQTQTDTFFSKSPLIASTLVPALLSGSNNFNIDLVKGSKEIQRVEAYALGDKVIPDPNKFPGKFFISRIATQKKSDGTDEHLEVFLKAPGGSDEKQFNVFDPAVQQVLIGAFRSVGPAVQKKQLLIDVVTTDDKVTSVTLGKFPGK